ncbi:rano class II histocompatibility antigen, A beta chain-like, partial [Oncorhynchus masou masou]|uniref:rano class II histocompatibility antigen, A beta chain-like n=1 Tax=Oncorhynchus masou masou TaxID=90313 RepID=UPI003182D4C3
LTVLVIILTPQDGHFITILNLCYYRGEDPHDVEYIWRAISDLAKVMEYNSTLNRFTGYTPIGIHKAEQCNADLVVLASFQTPLHFFCKHYGNSILLYYFPLSVEPSVHLRSMTPHGDRHPSMLTYSAYEFYPKQIRVTWLRNGQEVTSNMTSSEELVNGDWHYQIHSYLEYTPTPGEKISCMVEPTSFTEPKILHWDMSLPESERSKIAIGASGLVLGVVFAAAGLFYYNRRKTTGGDGEYKMFDDGVYIL